MSPADPADSDTAPIDILEFVAIFINVCGSSLNLSDGMNQGIPVHSSLPPVLERTQELSRRCVSLVVRAAQPCDTWLEL
jgi:hypothetical protein